MAVWKVLFRLWTFLTSITFIACWFLYLIMNAQTSVLLTTISVGTPVESRRHFIRSFFAPMFFCQSYMHMLPLANTGWLNHCICVPLLYRLL